MLLDDSEASNESEYNESDFDDVVGLTRRVVRVSRSLGLGPRGLVDWRAHSACWSCGRVVGAPLISWRACVLKWGYE